jgi:hypothetical protein
MRRENTSKRSAIEGTISALKRGRGAGRLRVKGIVKCSLTAGMKVIAQNIRQLVSYFQRSCALFLDNLHRNVQQNQAVRA